MLTANLPDQQQLETPACKSPSPYFYHIAASRGSGKFALRHLPAHFTPRTRSPYFYHIAASRGSGEFALRHLLAPGAWAHSPMAKRLLELNKGVPVSFIYGAADCEYGILKV